KSCFSPAAGLRMLFRICSIIAFRLMASISTLPAPDVDGGALVVPDVDGGALVVGASSRRRVGVTSVGALSSSLVIKRKFLGTNSRATTLPRKFGRGSFDVLYVMTTRSAEIS